MSDAERRSWAEDAVEAARVSAEALMSEEAQQAREDGIRMAIEATARLGEIFTRGGPFGSMEGVDEESYRRFRAETERMFDAWVDVLRASFNAYMDAADRALTYRPGGGRRSATDDVRLSPIVAGESTTATVWIRNPTDGPLVGIELRCSDLVSDAGDVITRDQIVIDPEAIDLVEPRATSTASVRLTSRRDAVPGVYRGSISSNQLPDVTITAQIVAGSS